MSVIMAHHRYAAGSTEYFNAPWDRDFTGGHVGIMYAIL